MSWDSKFKIQSINRLKKFGISLWFSSKIFEFFRRLTVQDPAESDLKKPLKIYAVRYVIVYNIRVDDVATRAVAVRSAAVFFMRSKIHDDGITKRWHYRTTTLQNDDISKGDITKRWLKKENYKTMTLRNDDITKRWHYETIKWKRRNWKTII